MAERHNLVLTVALILVLVSVCYADHRPDHTIVANHIGTETDRAGLIPLGVGTAVGKALTDLGFNLMFNLPVLGILVGPLLIIIGGVLRAVLGILLG